MRGEAWQLGPLDVPPEQRLHGSLEVDVGVTQVDVPIILINGNQPDPVLFISAGMDGDEYAACQAALRLAEVIDPAQVAGRILICPILDPLSFEALHSQNPLDGLFLKHVLPGDAQGKPTQRLARSIYDVCILPADVWIDLQTAGIADEVTPFVWTFQGDDAQLNGQNHRLLQHASAALALTDPPFAWNPGPQAMLASTALLVSCAGRRHNMDPAAVEAHLAVVRSVLRGLRVLPPDEHAQDQATAVYLESAPQLAEATGLWYPAISAGETVHAGQVIGEVRALNGEETLQVVRSSADGIALVVRAGLAARPRLRLALIAARPQHNPEARV